MSNYSASSGQLPKPPHSWTLPPAQSGDGSSRAKFPCSSTAKPAKEDATGSLKLPCEISKRTKNASSGWQGTKKPKKPCGQASSSAKSTRQKTSPVSIKTFRPDGSPCAKLPTSFKSVAVASTFLRKRGDINAEQLTGAWDQKIRPWFIHKDSVEKLKNDPDYQKRRRNGQKAVEAMIGKSIYSDPDANAEPPQRRIEERADLPFGYTREERRIIKAADMW